MSQRRFISRFTPSRTNPGDLEKIFVQRHALLDDAVARVRESATTDNKHHLLFVGPRGSGKTNLVTLLFHRIDQQTDLRDRVRIAWLNEDETSTTFLDFLLRTYRALAKKYPSEFPLADLDPLYELDLSTATDQIGRLLLTKLANRPVLLLVENLNELFGSLGDQGQKSWRAFIQDHPVFTIVATAQRLFDSVTRRTSPFFGFFQTEHLRPLTVSEAIALLENIAALNNDRDLGEYLLSRVGRTRVRALHHLTGGNHRVYVVLSEFITRDSIDQLVGPFENMIDELTPYYQERLRWLAPLQRKIVEHLCSHAHPIPVKDIAKALFSSHQTIASQLKFLRELGYVESHPRGRESLYELSEPLMRLCVEVKENQQRKPLRLIVDFLRVWYDSDKLEAHLSVLGEGAPERPYVIHALELLRTQEIPLRLQYLLSDLDKIDPETNGPDHLQCLRELVEERGNEEDCLRLGAELVRNAKWDEVIERATQARNSNVVSSPRGRGLLALCVGTALAATKRYHESVEEFTLALSTPGFSKLPLQYSLLQRATAFDRLDKFDLVIEDTSRLLKMPDANHEFTPDCLRLRAMAFAKLGRLDETALDLSRIVETAVDAGQRTWAIATRGVMLFLSDKIRESLSDLTQAIESPYVDQDLKANLLTFRSTVQMAQSQWDAAYKDLAQALQISVSDATDDASPIAHMIRAILHSAQDAAGWRPRVAELTRLFAAHHSLPVLGKKLVLSLSDLNEANLNEIGLDSWVSVWREIGVPYDDLAVPIRLLKTGVAYLKTKDEGVLLDLPKEERSILRQALNLPAESAES